MVNHQPMDVSDEFDFVDHVDSTRVQKLLSGLDFVDHVDSTRVQELFKCGKPSCRKFGNSFSTAAELKKHEG